MVMPLVKNESYSNAWTYGSHYINRKGITPFLLDDMKILSEKRLL
jgi:hypothetical protein